MSPPPEPSRFAYALTVVATLRDTDGLGHVNNAVYVSWFEEVRTRYVFDRMGFRDIMEFDFVLGSTTVHFRSPVYLHERVEMRCVPVRIGRSSWELAYEGRTEGDGRVVVEGSSVQVQYDYAAKGSKPLSGAWRRMLEADLSREG